MRRPYLVLFHVEHHAPLWFVDSSKDVLVFFSSRSLRYGALCQV